MTYFWNIRSSNFKLSPWTAQISCLSCLSHVCGSRPVGSACATPLIHRVFLLRLPDWNGLVVAAVFTDYLDRRASGNVIHNVIPVNWAMCTNNWETIIPMNTLYSNLIGRKKLNLLAMMSRAFGRNARWRQWLVDLLWQRLSKVSIGLLLKETCYKKAHPLQTLELVVPGRPFQLANSSALSPSGPKTIGLHQIGS